MLDSILPARVERLLPLVLLSVCAGLGFVLFQFPAAAVQIEIIPPGSPRVESADAAVASCLPPPLPHLPSVEIVRREPVREEIVPLVSERRGLKLQFQQLKQELDARPEVTASQWHDLAVWAKARGLATDSKRAMRRVIRVDPDHPGARAALGYVEFEGDWLTVRQLERLADARADDEMMSTGIVWGEGGWQPWKPAR